MNNDTRERFTLRMPTELYEALKAEADALGVSLNGLILQILWTWAENQTAAK